jgi:N-acetyltransferase
VQRILDKQPTLESERLLIRPLREGDFDDLYAVASDRELWALHPVTTRYQEPIFRALFAESLASGGALVVIDKATSKIIGSSRFSMPDANSGRAEIGWSYLARNYWGGAWNREVKQILLGHAFGFVDVVCFRVGEGNLRSRRAMEKIGGKFSAATESVKMADGTQVTHVIYEITKADFIADTAMSEKN